jgi:hypothetical protein
MEEREQYNAYTVAEVEELQLQTADTAAEGGEL